MKVLMILRGIPSQWDVSTNKYHYFIQRLREDGHHVRVVTFRPRGRDSGGAQDSGDMVTLQKPPRIRALLESLLSGLISGSLFISFDGFSLGMKQLIELTASSESHDVIYIDMAMAYPTLNWKTGVPKLLDIVAPRKFAIRQILIKEKNPKRKLWYLLNSINPALHREGEYNDYEAFAFVTPLHGQLEEDFLPRQHKSFIIPHGVKLDLLDPSANEEQPGHIVFTGLMAYAPNIHAVQYFCTSILPLVLEEVPDAKLFIVGSNPTPEVLKLKSSRVIVTGYVEEIRPYFNKAAVVVVPIVSDDGGYKLKTLEAMAMGKAVVSTSLGIKGLDLGDEENILVSDDPERFAQQVVRCLQTAEFRDRIGGAAHRHVARHYSIEHSYQLFVQALNTLCEEQPH